MHAGLLILLWAAFAAAIQFLPPVVLVAAATLCGLVALRHAPARARRLLHRVRFLVLAIIVLFAAFTPGEAVFPAFPAISPSREGVLFAVEHGLRLVAIVLSVALLLETLPTSRLVGGLHALLRPFGPLGLPTERLAVRLMLVLHYVESARPGDWRRWLAEGEGGHEERVAIVFGRESLGARDFGAIFLVAALAAIWLGVSV